MKLTLKTKEYCTEFGLFTPDGKEIEGVISIKLPEIKCRGPEPTVWVEFEMADFDVRLASNRWDDSPHETKILYGDSDV